MQKQKQKSIFIFKKDVKMIIQRDIIDKFVKHLEDNKAIILMGARQVGKTTILKHLFKNKDNVLWLNGDDSDTREILANSNQTILKSVIGNKKIIVIDEAQRIENIGLTLKILTDSTKIKVIATGSASFDLSNKINEPLTGRKWEYNILPISFKEMVNHNGLLEEKRMLKHRMIFGYYPDVINNSGDEIEILRNLSNSYLYKDILTFDKMKKSSKIEKLLQALAFQVGSEVSYTEISKLIGLNSQTVEKYIGILEDAYIIFRVNCLSRNLRNELKKSKKIYFYDNGVRNAIISQYNFFDFRQDKGALWENFLMSERQKYIENNGKHCNQFFWRTRQQQEIDYIEEKDGKLYAYEFKWNPLKKVRFTPTFSNAYPNSEFKVITEDNYLDFIL